jgi:hypothetical protein
MTRRWRKRSSVVAQPSSAMSGEVPYGRHRIRSLRRRNGRSVARGLINPGAFEGRGEGRPRSATGPLSEPPGVETQGSGGAEAPGGEVARRRFECLRGKAGG